jgi:RES domain-containing protein
MRVFRVADRRFPLFDGMGARLTGGRWNSPGRPVIYAAASFAGALLETLVHSNLGRAPKTHAVIEIVVPDSLIVESIGENDLPGWDDENQTISRAFGDAWLMEQRSAVLLVPSVITQGRERNVLINPDHRDFSRITASTPEPVSWDRRLFQRRS